MAVAFVCALVATVLIETTVLFVGLSSRWSRGVRLFSGVWLSACTLPIVWLVVPELLSDPRHRWLSIATSEVLAPAGECLLFWRAFLRHVPWTPSLVIRDFGTIVIANLASFAAGEWYHANL